MINRRFMIVPPALPSGGHTESLAKTSQEFLCLHLEVANMRVPLHSDFDWLNARWLQRRQVGTIDHDSDTPRHPRSA
jgi:hypothetical protein